MPSWRNPWVFPFLLLILTIPCDVNGLGIYSWPLSGILSILRTRSFLYCKLIHFVAFGSALPSSRFEDTFQWLFRLYNGKNTNTYCTRCRRYGAVVWRPVEWKCISKPWIETAGRVLNFLHAVFRRILVEMWMESKKYWSVWSRREICTSLEPSIFLYSRFGMKGDQINILQVGQ